MKLENINKAHDILNYIKHVDEVLELLAKNGASIVVKVDSDLYTHMGLKLEDDKGPLLAVRDFYEKQRIFLHKELEAL